MGPADKQLGVEYVVSGDHIVEEKHECCRGLKLLVLMREYADCDVAEAVPVVEMPVLKPGEGF